MLPGANVLIDVVRLHQQTAPVLYSVPLTTPDDAPFITSEEARAGDPPATGYVIIPPALSQSAGMFLFAVDPDTDIVASDRLVRIVNISDEVTRWPNDSILPNPNEQWIVRYVRVLPEPISERWCWVERMLLGGNMHLTN